MDVINILNKAIDAYVDELDTQGYEDNDEFHVLLHEFDMTCEEYVQFRQAGHRPLVFNEAANLANKMQDNAYGHYLVIVTQSQDIISVHPCIGEKEAITTANELLMAHLNEMVPENDNDNLHQQAVDVLAKNSTFASIKEGKFTHACCNINTHWKASIVEMPVVFQTTTDSRQEEKTPTKASAFADYLETYRRLANFCRRSVRKGEDVWPWCCADNCEQCAIAIAMEMFEREAREDLFSRAYDLYKADWCKTRNFPLADVEKAWENDEEYNGQMYVCRAEFADCEFEDEAYMRQLLPKDDFKLWAKLREPEAPVC